LSSRIYSPVTKMAGKRRYDDACAAAHALDLVGERWALLVARELMLGPRRFTDLRMNLPGISPNVLTQRLDELEKAAIVRRRRLPPPASVWVYELTDWGLELEPVLQTFGRWAARSPLKPDGMPISVNSLILSFRTMFDAAAARGFKATLELRFGDSPFRVRVAGGRLEAVPGTAEAPAAVIEADPNALAAVVYGGRKLADALRAGELRIDGDRAVVERFVTLFPLPEKAPIAD
jgi:DNA-binding HxlR family transcriptional regulator